MRHEVGRRFANSGQDRRGTLAGIEQKKDADRFGGRGEKGEPLHGFIIAKDEIFGLQPLDRCSLPFAHYHRNMHQSRLDADPIRFLRR